MNLNLYKQALDLENSNPRRAFELYTNLEHENLNFQRDILLIGILCPIIAFILEYLMNQYFEVSKFVVTIFVWGFIGFSPIYFLYEKKRKEIAGISFKRPHNIFIPPIHIITLIFRTSIHSLIILVMAAILSLCVLSIIGPIYHLMSGIALTTKNFYEVPDFLFFPVMAIFFFYCLLVIVVNPRRMDLEYILIGAKLKWKKVLYFVLTLILVAILNNFPIITFYSNILKMFILFLLANMLFSAAFGYLEEDYVFGQLIKVAKIRCLLYLGRYIESEFLRDELKELAWEQNLKFITSHSNFMKTVGPLIDAINLIVDYPEPWWPQRSFDAFEYLSAAKYSIESSDPYREIYLDSIQKTERLIHPFGEGDSHYVGIGRVVATGYRYPEGEDPREYEKDEYEYYKTGQWLDIKVLDGVMFFNRPFHQGEIIKGIWPCGKTAEDYTPLLYHNGKIKKMPRGYIGALIIMFCSCRIIPRVHWIEILGKPNLGDIVGYSVSSFGFLDDYVYTWKKI